MKTLRLVWFVCFARMAVSASAQTVPDMINYQGRLMDGTNLFNGTVPITLNLYNAPSGGMFPYCTDSNDVVVVDGLYSTYIGDNITWGSLDNALVQTQVWIEVVIGTNVMTPREQMVSVGFALYSAKLPFGAVKMDMIAENAVQYYHIANNAIRGNHVQAGSVSNTHLAEGAVAFENLQRGYEAGSFDITPNSYGFYTNFTQFFAEPFRTVPVVTLNLSFDMAIENLNAQLLVLNSTVSNFMAQIRMDPYELPLGSPTYVSPRGWYPSLKMVSGRVACAFVEASASYALHYLRSSNAMGTSWGNVVSLYTNGTVGNGPSMILVNGNPAIAFCDTDNGTLYYLRSSNSVGYSGWSARRTVDATSSAGEYASLAIIQGHPAISYYRAAVNDLMFIRANDSNGVSWTAGNAVVAVAGVQISGKTTLLDVDGSPAICYYDAGSDDLKFVRAADTHGSNWWPAVTVASAGDVGAYCSMALVDGYPAISYLDRSGSTNLMYVRASNAQGSGWGSPVLVDTNASIGFYTSLCVIQGKPAIAYSGGTGAGSHYVRAADTLGNLWNRPSRLYDPGITIVGRGTALEDVNGTAGIMFSTWIPQRMDFITVTNVNARINWMAIER